MKHTRPPGAGRRRSLPLGKHENCTKRMVNYRFRHVVGKPAVLKAGGSACPFGQQTLCATRPDLQSGSDSWALRAQLPPAAKALRPWNPTGNVPVRSYFTRRTSCASHSSGQRQFPPIAFSVCENGRLPKNPRCADNGDGCTFSRIVCFAPSISGFFPIA